MSACRVRSRAPALFLLLTLIWPAALLAAPWLGSDERSGPVAVRIAAGLYVLGGVLCHQRPERSFHLWGAQLPVCARCAGIYLGAPLGAAAILAWTRRRAIRVSRPASWLALAAIAAPALATVAWEWWSGHPVSAGARALSGALPGAAVAAAVSVALDRRLKVD